MNGSQVIIMPQILDMQKEILLNLNEVLQQSQGDQQPNGDTRDNNTSKSFNPFKLLGYFSHQLELPGWFRKIAPFLGMISIFISISYLLCGVFFLMLRPFAPAMFGLTLGISMIWSTISVVIYGVSDNILLIMKIPGSITSVIIDIVLLTIILLHGKQAFMGKI